MKIESPKIVYPFYIKSAVILIGFCAFISILYIAQYIILPLVYATIIAIVLSPIVDFLVHKKVNRILAISITIFFVSVFAIVSIVLVFSQATRFWENFPYMVVKFDLFMHQIEYWVASTFHISSNNIKHWIDDTNSEIISGSRIYLGKTLINIGSILIH
jgi:predicted PurR-regulated permease PerM